MKRDLEKNLIEWMDHPLRKPLILRGARQVGKTWLIQEFSKRFEIFISLNFEKEPELQQLFKGNIDIGVLLERLSLYGGQKLVPGKTLIFFDEVQECPRAVTALRYFKEEYPEFHVIAAGSLLDFTIEKIGIPVGRVQFLFLHPLSFGEFLTAMGENALRQALLIGKKEKILHSKLIEAVKSYLWIGGMPAVVKAWIDRRNLVLCQELQDDILYAYQQDFEKYARKNQIDKVEKVFSAIPTLLGKKFKYTSVDPHVKARSIQSALALLEKAKIIHFVYHAAGHLQPLKAIRNEKKFKVFFFDVGLAQRLLGLDLQEWVLKELDVNNLGGITEQFVAQEYIAYTSSKQPHNLHYWHKEDSKSSAEIDFLFIRNQAIIPVEVKSGEKGHLKSMYAFLELHPNCPQGLKISQQFFRNQNRLEGIPLYAIESWLKAKK